MVRYSIEVTGLVQGVGFRPFAFNLAKSLSLSGFVRNTPEGVSLEVEGSRPDCDTFIARLKSSLPPLAHLERLLVTEIPLAGDPDFTILSSGGGEHKTFISPDIGICDDCASDITQKGNRRYRYAFTNCTNCGPRFTIIQEIPYDRKNTTMGDFPMCPDCQREYEDPYNRRFHAQPNACPECGPHLRFYQAGTEIIGDPYELFHEAMTSGQIVALKGLGGYHLACDATKESAVRRLREKKLRYDKPFAVMMRDTAAAAKYCQLSPEEAALLTSPRKPIVLLRKKSGGSLAPSTAPGNTRIGVMLPYTPLHKLLMEEQEALIMTSGNLSDYPMIYRDEEALTLLPQVADSILTHNRRILRRMDDSVCFVSEGKTHLLRRARGYVPEPVHLGGSIDTILAVGAQQKNTFCLVKGENAFLSGHIGDLDNGDTAACFESEIDAFMRIFDAVPKAIACDMHPDYISTRYALSQWAGLPLYPIQHHHAHFASVLAEHQRMDKNAIGLIFDGTGYGEDGCIWGGEVLFGNARSSTRMGHLLYFPLLGGDAAIREPWRAALAAAEMALGPETALSLFPQRIREAELLLMAGKKQVNSPLTSSMGRLFDAVAALAGIRQTTTYEGQAAVELQQLLDETAEGSYHFLLTESRGGLLLDWRPIIGEILEDRKAGVRAGVISRRFHHAVAELIVSSAAAVRRQTHCQEAVLSGGVFQNDYLLRIATQALESEGFTVYTNEMIPANDGGISFGQAASASCKMR